MKIDILYYVKPEYRKYFEDVYISNFQNMNHNLNQNVLIIEKLEQENEQLRNELNKPWYLKLKDKLPKFGIRNPFYMIRS